MRNTGLLLHNRARYLTFKQSIRAKIIQLYQKIKKMFELI